MAHSLHFVLWYKRTKTRVDRQVPAIILTGDITLGDGRELWPDKCLLVQKPVAAKRLKEVIDQLLEDPPG